MSWRKSNKIESDGQKDNVSQSNISAEIWWWEKKQQWEEVKMSPEKRNKRYKELGFFSDQNCKILLITQWYLFSFETERNHREHWFNLQARGEICCNYLIALCSRLSSLSLFPHRTLQKPHARTISFTAVSKYLWMQIIQLVWNIFFQNCETKCTIICLVPLNNFKRLNVNNTKNIISIELFKENLIMILLGKILKKWSPLKQDEFSDG